MAKARYRGPMMNSRAERLWYMLAVAVGMLCAIIGLHTDNVQFNVLFIFVQCAVFGFARPTHAWRWAFMIALCIPLSLAFNMVVTLPSPRDLSGPARLFVAPLVVFFRSPNPVSAGEMMGSLVALLPGLAGAYLGAWMSRVAAPAA
jgi:hypothetical protein